MQVDTQKLLQLVKAKMADYEVENLSLRMLLAQSNKKVELYEQEVNKLVVEINKLREQLGEEVEDDSEVIYLNDAENKEEKDKK